MRELDEENARPERGQILSARVATLLDEEPRSLQRLSGGSKKGAYRVQLHDDSTVIAYVWDSAENYWPDGDGEREPFTSASGQQLFLGTHATLQALGVRTVEIVASDNGVTLVEDLVGGSLEQLIGTDPARGREGVARLQDMLAVMHAATSDGVGKVGAPICEPADTLLKPDCDGPRYPSRSSTSSRTRWPMLSLGLPGTPLSTGNLDPITSSWTDTAHLS